MDILTGSFVCILILVFFGFSILYLPLDKHRLRIETLWKQLEPVIDSWCAQTKEIAQRHKDTPDATSVLEDWEGYSSTGRVCEKIRCVNKMLEHYSRNDAMAAEGGAESGRQKLCSEINYRSFYLNDAIATLNKTIDGHGREGIARTFHFDEYQALLELI